MSERVCVFGVLVRVRVLACCCATHAYLQWRILHNEYLRLFRLAILLLLLYHRLGLGGRGGGRTARTLWANRSGGSTITAASSTAATTTVPITEAVCG